MEALSTKQSENDTPLKKSLRQEIEAGIGASRDPDNASLPDLVPRITTIYSPWYTRICPECKLKFREDDRVRLCPVCGQAYHDDDQYELHCWQEHFATGHVCKKGGFDYIAEAEIRGCDYKWPGRFPSDKDSNERKVNVFRHIDQISTLFLSGLEQVWSSFGDKAVLKVKPGDPIVGRKCPWCRFMIRAGDRVVKCPCGKCSAYFHNDIFRHLTCWNDWNDSKGNDYCPITGARIEKKVHGPKKSDEEIQPL